MLGPVSLRVPSHGTCAAGLVCPGLSVDSFLPRDWEVFWFFFFFLFLATPWNIKSPLALAHFSFSPHS